MVDFDYSDMGAYLVSIARRIAQLEVVAHEMEAVVDEESDRIGGAYREFQHDIKNLEKQIQGVKKEMSELTLATNHLIEGFKRIARKNSIHRLERKIDAWNPEKMATHNDLHRNIEKLR